jgi:uncharacterized protein (TIGR00251 family)
LKESPAIRDAILETSDSVSFAVRLSPRSGKTQFIGIIGKGPDAVFRIAVAAPPVEGRANEALISYLSDVLDVPRSSVEIVSNEHSRNKALRVKRCSAVQVAKAFEPDMKAQLRQNQKR